MEAVQNSEERKVKNLKVGTVDPYARTLAVTQKALTLTHQEQIVKDLNFLTALEQEVTKKANKAKREYRQFATNEKTKRNLAAMVPIIPLTGAVDELPVVNNLAVGTTVISLAYAGTVFVSSKLDTYIKREETKEYTKACRYIKYKAYEQKKAIINSIR